MIMCLTCLNALAIIVGAAMVGSGTWLLSGGTSVFEVLSALDSSLGSGVSLELLVEVAERKGLLRTLAIVTTTAGVAAIATAVLGIVALLQRNSLLAIVYKSAVFLALVAHIGGTAYVMFKKPSLETDIKTAMLRHQMQHFVARTSYFNVTGKLNQAVTKFFEHMHISFECCGVLKPDDIRNSSSYRKSIASDPAFTDLMPASCCKLKNKNGALAGKAMQLVDADCTSQLNSSALHQQPCFVSVRQRTDKIILPLMLGCGLFAVLLATALGMMAAQMCAGFDNTESDSDSGSDSGSD